MIPLSGEQNWKVPVTAEDYFSQQSRRIGQEERRPAVRKASDLLGPGIAPFAVPVDSLESDTAAFNGYYLIRPQADGSPDTAKWWVGQTVADQDNGGTQWFATFRSADQGVGGHFLMMRSFVKAPDSAQRFYSAWQQVAPPPPTESAGPREDMSSYLTGATATLFDIRRDGKWREIRGNPNRNLATGSTDIATAFPAGDRPSANVFNNCYLAGGNVGVAFIRPNGTIALNNMSGAARSGAHQFTLIYTVD